MERHVVEGRERQEDSSVTFKGVEFSICYLGRSGDPEAGQCGENLPMMLGQKRKMFSWGPLLVISAVLGWAEPLPLSNVFCSSLSDAAAAAAATWRLDLRVDMFVVWRCVRSDPARRSFVNE